MIDEQTEKNLLIESLLDKSFRIFLHNAHFLLSDDRFNNLLLSNGDEPIEITQPETTCQWMIGVGYQDDQMFWCKSYELLVSYKYDDELTLQSVYSLCHDLQRDEIHYHRRFTRIVALEDDGPGYTYAEYIYKSDFTPGRVQTVQLIPF